MNRRHALITLTALATGLLTVQMVGCTGLVGPTVITLSEAEIAALIERSFPLTRRVLEVLDVQLQAPRLHLLPAQNRLAVDLTVQTQDRLFGKTGRGQLLFDSALRYDPRDATVRLTQVRVQQVNLSAGSAVTTAAGPPLAPHPAPIPPRNPPPVPAPLPALSGAIGSAGPAGPPGPPSTSTRLGNALAERVLDDLVIYRVPADRLASLRQLGLQPGAVTITARGLEITLARLGS